MDQQPAQRTAGGGGTAFWIDAIKTRMASEFASAEVKDAGGFKVLELVDRTENAYRYLVGVKVDGDHLKLIEGYYPGDAQQTRYGASVLEAIRKGKLM